MPSDSSEIDAALVLTLVGDQALMAEATDGVYFDEAPPGATRFIVLSLLDAHDEPMFGKTAYEDALYLVKYVALSTTGANLKAGAARIDALLDYGTLTIVGYSLLVMRREARIRISEVDQIDRSIRWQHRGGHYRIQASPS